jgi:hypothetical protein
VWRVAKAMQKVRVRFVLTETVVEVDPATPPEDMEMLRVALGGYQENAGPLYEALHEKLIETGMVYKHNFTIRTGIIVRPKHEPKEEPQG